MISGKELPPSSLSGPELANWWRHQLQTEGLSGIPTTADRERICPRCDAINACTGIDDCSSCNYPLESARRVDTERFNPNKY